MNDNEPSRPRVVPPSHRRNAALTHVELTWIEKKIEHWLRFGRRADEKILDRRRSISSFKPGSIFAFVRWASNDYGTVVSRMDIVRAVEPGARFQTLPFVRPGGEAASGGARAHGAILATSAASAAISRAAVLCSASSKTRRPDCAASAKTTR